MIKKYYINLERSKDRRLFMENKYKNITRIDAFDGKELKKYNNIILPEKKYCKQNKLQLGCSLSHIKAIITAYENNDKEALILEDDMSDEFSHKWEKNIKEIISNAPLDHDLISLYTNNDYIMKDIYKKKEDYIKWYYKHFSTGCYYINRKGMEKIYNLFYKNKKIDLSIKLKNYVADDGVIYNNLISYLYTKPTFINVLFTSTIVNNLSAKVPRDIILDYFENIN
jgi:GR25 family glycosyltransferase involved in LPS biosynthesis